VLRSPWSAYEAPTGRARQIARKTWRERVSFGGVAFELLSPEPLAHDLVGDDQRFWQQGADPRVIADVACAVHVDDGHDFGERGNTIAWQTDPASDTTRVRARSLEVELSKVGERRYAAAARVANVPEALVGLLRALAGAVAQREGGLMLHAAAVELDGQGVLFIGPSGAGKSTAAHLTDGARCFAFDHVAVVPVETGVLAWGLPGGTAARAPLASAVVYPLVAAFRVRRSPELAAPRVQWLAGASALFALRESVECGDLTLASEDVHLQAVTRLSAQLQVGAIHTVLDTPHGGLLRVALQEAAVRAEARRT
jgi:hypothetical protein